MAVAEETMPGYGHGLCSAMTCPAWRSSPCLYYQSDRLRHAVQSLTAIIYIIKYTPVRYLTTCVRMAPRRLGCHGTRSK